MPQVLAEGVVVRLRKDTLAQQGGGDRAAKRGGKLEEFVASGVTKRLVDHVEPVEVDEDQPNRGSSPRNRPTSRLSCCRREVQCCSWGLPA